MKPAGVRGEQESIPVKTLEDHGLTLLVIRQWREAESHAGRPSGLAGFYAAHELGMDCGTYGAQMIGWGKPRIPEEAENAKQLGLEALPVYKVCRPAKAERSS